MNKCGKPFLLCSTNNSVVNLSIIKRFFSIDSIFIANTGKNSKSTDMFLIYQLNDLFIINYISFIFLLTSVSSYLFGQKIVLKLTKC